MIWTPWAFPLIFLCLVELGGCPFACVSPCKGSHEHSRLVHATPCAYFQEEENIITVLFIFPKDTKVDLIYKYYLICCVTG